jgi:hypothetical protein
MKGRGSSHKKGGGALLASIQNDMRVGLLNVGSASTALVKLPRSSLCLNLEMTVSDALPKSRELRDALYVTCGIFRSEEYFRRDPAYQVTIE